MSAPHDFHPDPIEEDPTGMRALLSSLPDPGPMPADLVARITASLTAELASPALDELASRRERRLRRPLLVAAAAAVVLAGGGAVLTTGLPGSIVASVQAGDSAGSSAKSLAAQHGADAESGGAAGFGTENTVVIRSGTRYAAADLPAAAAALRSSPEVTTSRVEGTDDAGDVSSGVASVAGARACAAALGIPAEVSVVVDVATIDGTPGAVVLAETGTGTDTAYAVGMRCGTGATDLILGPVTLP